MASIHVEHRDEGRCKVTHSRTQSDITTDRPAEYGGKGRSFSSTDLVAAALGSCMMTSIEAVLEREGIDPGKVAIDIRKTLAHNPNRIEALNVEIRCPNPLEPILKKKLLRVAATCAVKKSLNPEVAVTTSIADGENTTDGQIQAAPGKSKAAGSIDKTLQELPMRHATEADLPGIVDIYNSTVSTRLSTADTEPVTVASKRDWFRRHTPKQRPLMVHDVEGQVAAWVSFEPFYGRPAYRHTAEISIYIDPEHRRKGLGRRILGSALDMAPGLGIRSLVAFIFSHNTPSLQLFKSLGFRAWGSLPDVAEMDGKEYSLTILGKRMT